MRCVCKWRLIFSDEQHGYDAMCAMDLALPTSVLFLLFALLALFVFLIILIILVFLVVVFILLIFVLIGNQSTGLCLG